MNNKNIAWTLAYQIVSAMLIPIAIGYSIDTYYMTLPWGIIIGSIFGMISVFVLLFKMIQNSK